MGIFVLTFVHGKTTIFYTVMSAYFKDYSFGIMEFILLVNIVVSFCCSFIITVAVIFIAIIIIIIISTIIVVVIIIILALFIYLFYPDFDIIVVSILRAFKLE